MLLGAGAGIASLVGSGGLTAPLVMSGSSLYASGRGIRTLTISVLTINQSLGISPKRVARILTLEEAGYCGDRVLPSDALSECLRPISDLTDVAEPIDAAER